MSRWQGSIDRLKQKQWAEGRHPTTAGEWTEARVRGFFEDQENKNPFPHLAFCINAAITTEREKREQAERVAQVCYDLHEALGVKWGDDPYEAIRQLREQLATLRENAKHYRALFDQVRRALGTLIPVDATKKEIIDTVAQLATRPHNEQS